MVSLRRMTFVVWVVAIVGLLACPALAADLTWVRASSGGTPDGAIPGGGENGSKYYLCRAAHEGVLYPGYLFGHTCNFGLKGAEIEGQIYEVLTGDAGLVQWVPAQGGKKPAGAFVGSDESGRPMVVCRGKMEGAVIPGKLIGSNCSFTWHAEELKKANYEVMVAPPAVVGAAPVTPPVPAPVVMAPPSPPTSPASTAGPASTGMSWKRLVGGRLPPGAIVGGKENGRPLFVCRVGHAGGLHPGKLVGNNCNIGWGGKEIVSNNVEVLTGDAGAVRWVAAQGGQIPDGAFVGGSEGGRQLVVCRINHQNGVHPGKIVGSNCNIGWGGKEITNPSYEALVVESASGGR